MEAQGLLPQLNASLWASRMTAENLYSEHWLLAYEALMKGWLPSKDGSDYLSADPFFSILKTGNVEFYDSNEPWEDGYSDYSDGDDLDEDEDDEDDDEDKLDEELEENPPIFVPGMPGWPPGTTQSQSQIGEANPPIWAAPQEPDEPEDA